MGFEQSLISFDSVWPETCRENTLPTLADHHVLDARRVQMNKVGILAPLQSRPGKEAEVEQVLQPARPLVEAETGTTAWFAFKVGPATFGIFDTFEDEEGRKAHINGEVAKALFARAEELFVTHPQIQTADILAEKLQEK